MKRYAIIDENNMCVGNARTPSEIKADNYIELKDGEVVELGYIWNGETWEEGEMPAPSDPQPTQLDRIEAAVAKSNEEIAQEARDAYTLELIEGGVIA